MHFSGSCAAVTLFLVVAVQMCPTLHVGVRITAAACMIGQGTRSVLTGAVVVR